jgi:pimeloyl-ACP methyl ester carboxylesterase
MSRWLKVLLAVIAALVVLLILNAVALDRQTKDAESVREAARDGATILPLPGGDVKAMDTGAGAPIAGKPPIVLLHCYTCAIDWWDRVIPLLRPAHRVIAIDLLGHGGSEKPRSGYSMEEQAQLVAQALDRLGVTGPVTVVGHSLGGAVATALNEQSPELVGGIVIIDTEPDTSYGGLGLLARATYTPVIGEALWRVKVDATIREGLKEAFAPGFDVPDEFVDDVKQMTYSAFDGSHSGFDSYVGESPLDQRLRESAAPLLVIFGAEEQIVDDPREALSAYAGVPDAQTELIQGAGHSPNVEKPAETARLILNMARGMEVRESARTRAAQRDDRPASRKVTADCDSDTLAGSGDPDWRRRSTVVGDFGLYGRGRDFSLATRTGSVYVTKIPAFLEGQAPVTLRVPPTEVDRVGLIYGPIHDARALSEAATEVRFVPCRGKPRTPFPGALALADRDPVTLEVVTGRSVKTIRIG